MGGLLAAPKRLLVGRPLRSERLGEQLLPKKLALPVFCSDPLSSNAYATEEILLVLSLAGLALLHLTPWIAAAVVLLLIVVVASYRQTCHAYPNGGGAYAVSRANLGANAALVAASALLVDYVLTVAVSVAAGVANIVSAFPGLAPHAVPIAVGFVALLAVMNLRGVRESGMVFAVPTYGFIVVVFVMLGVGAYRAVIGDTPAAESASFSIEGQHPIHGLLLVALILRAFSSGCTALTGVEAVSNGVPHFRPPKSRNAAATLAIMGGLTVAMFVGITALALVADVHVAEDPARLLGAPEGYEQRTVIAQEAGAVLGNGSPLFYAVQGFTAAILILAANTAFNGFPILASILGGDGYLPRQFHRRGDRLVFSNGIVVLAGLAGLLIYAFDASTTRLIQLYIIGVFVSFTLSQVGMVRHWTRQLRSAAASEQRRGGILRARFINGLGRGVHRAGSRGGAADEVHPRRVHRRHRDARPVSADAGDQAALRHGCGGAASRARWCHAAQPRARGGAGLPAPRAHPAGAGVRAGHPAEHPGRADRTNLQGRDRGAAAGMGGTGHPGRARGPRLSVPRRDRPTAALHRADPPGKPARRGGRLHPRVRGRALVGAAAAQPERAATQGPIAVPIRRHGHQRAVAAAFRRLHRRTRRGQRGASSCDSGAVTPTGVMPSAFPRRRRGLPARRRRLGLLLASLALPILTAALVAVRGDLALGSVLLLYLLAVVAISVVGGLVAGVATAIGSFLLANFFLTPPYHTLVVESGDSIITLLVFLVVAVTVSVLVDVAARRQAAAARSEAEADMLGRAVSEPLTQRSPEDVLAEVATTFGLTSVALVEGERQTVLARVGPDSRDPVTLKVPAGGDRLLIGAGRELFAEDRRFLGNLAHAAGRAVDVRALTGEAERARILAEVDTVRTALLAAVGHDLRTPLAGIKAAVTTLRQPDVDLAASDRSELLAAIEHSTDRLTDLIANLLDLSRLEAGAVSINVEAVSLDEVISRVLIDRRLHTVVNRVADNLPLVAADAGLLERIVANLVDNAHRHAPPGSPVIIDAETAGDVVRLAVVDHGPGVAETEWARMFVPFQRLDDRGTDTGVGLGLAIARGFANAMGGTLEPGHTPGGGLTMTLTLPRVDVRLDTRESKR